MLLYTWELLRTNLKYSLHKKRDLAVWADGYVNFLEPGNLSTVYMYVKSSHYTLNIYDYICQSFLNKFGMNEWINVSWPPNCSCYLCFMVWVNMTLLFQEMKLNL